jgi:hypothetical protein
MTFKLRRTYKKSIESPDNLAGTPMQSCMQWWHWMATQFTRQPENKSENLEIFGSLPHTWRHHERKK